ncbi:hypothetical protein DFS33DRAFT_1423771 [Desarmillaria ectypa]|nr:hypothetical protein DFS33DRAFT_1423771 [Desarmillaria ectypa]
MNQYEDSILDDVRNVLSVPLGDFQQSFLPQVVSSTQIDDIATRSQINGSLQPNVRWTLFPINPCMEWLAEADDYHFQNNKKILGNAAHMMYADSCRRFMFGMTIANTMTLFWFFSRAMIVVSEPFDFILRTESDIQKTSSSAFEANDPEARENPFLYKQYFMDIHACEVVIRTDKTEDAIASPSDSYCMYDAKRWPSSSAASRLPTTIFSNTADPVGGALAGPSQRHHPQHLYTGRKHVRVLFTKVGTPLDKVQNQKMLFTGPLHAFTELKHLYITSYVHRDISSGNILICSGNRGEISDLEHAKGTPIFMATEAQWKRYLFKAKQAVNYVTLALELDSILPHQRDVASLRRSKGIKTPGGYRRNTSMTYSPMMPKGLWHAFTFSNIQKNVAITLCLPKEFRDVTVALDVIPTALDDAYTSVEAQEYFPQYSHFAKLFEQLYFEEMLKSAVMGAIMDVQFFQLEDQPTREGAEDEVDWTPDGLKEENYADYDPPENDADNFRECPPEGHCN